MTLVTSTNSLEERRIFSRGCDMKQKKKAKEGEGAFLSRRTGQKQCISLTTCNSAEEVRDKKHECVGVQGMMVWHF